MMNCMIKNKEKDMTTKGTPEGDVAKLVYLKDGNVIISIPPYMLEELSWKAGDELDISSIEICFDWGEVQGLTLRNLTKEKLI